MASEKSRAVPSGSLKDHEVTGASYQPPVYFYGTCGNAPLGPCRMQTPRCSWPRRRDPLQPGTLKKVVWTVEPRDANIQNDLGSEKSAVLGRTYDTLMCILSTSSPFVSFLWISGYPILDQYSSQSQNRTSDTK